VKAPALTDRPPVVSFFDNRASFWRYGAGVAGAVFAFLLRFGFDPLFHDKLPFAAFIIATTLVAWFAGFGPSVVTFLLGDLLGNWFFVEPRHSLALISTANISQNVSTLIVGASIILFGRSMHIARRRADAHARAAVAHQKLLEQEVIDRKRAEEEVRRLNADLEQRVKQRTAELLAANQELESFTYSVSHDLRAPVRHVDSYAQMLEEEFGPKLGDLGLQVLQKIRKGSDNMRQLIDDLLNLSHVGQSTLTLLPASLNRLVNEVISEIKPETTDREIDWQIADLPPVLCDAGLVKQVFANLLANAVKYTRPRQRAVIEVGQTAVDGENAIFVRDNGVGFNMKYAGKLFGVFQRLHRSEEFEGTGVGLATVARVIRKHGGRVWVNAEPDKGATFYFTFPQANFDNARQTENPPSKTASKPRTAPDPAPVAAQTCLTDSNSGRT